MKKIFFTTTLLLGLLSNAISQVNGFAFLKGKTDNSGIKVLFTAQSPTAKTDSAITASDGSYNISVASGAYVVYFSKTGFDSTYYNERALQVIKGPTTLDNISLSQKYSNPLSGNIKGILKSNTTYHVINTIYISDNDTLIIEPGAKIVADSMKEFNISGTLLAQGTANQKIYFENILLEPSSFDNNRSFEFNYCVFNTSCFWNGFMYAGGFFRMENSEMYNGQWGIALSFDSLLFRNNYIHDIDSNQVSDYTSVQGIGVSIGAQKGTIACNRIENCSKGGIYIGDTRYGININNGAIVCENNSISNIKSSSGTALTFVRHGAGNICRNNFISKAATGIATSDSKSSFYNNTIINCGKAISSTLSDVNLSIYNNILIGNKYAWYIDANNNIDLSHTFTNNLLFNNINTSNMYTNIFGVPFSKNSKGNDIDVYNNVLANPLAKNSASVSFENNSPVYGEGLNNTDIGFNPAATCLEDYFSTKTADTDTLSISGVIHQDLSYLITGKVIAYNSTIKTTYATITDTQGKFMFSSLPKGTYVIKAITNDSSQYKSTFYPNVADSSKTVPFALGGSISEIDLYMENNTLTGIEDDNLNVYIKVSPNPFENSLYVSLENNAQEFNVKLISLYGTIIKTQSSSIGELTLDTSSLQSGIYLLSIEQEGKTGVRKVIKH